MDELELRQALDLDPEGIITAPLTVQVFTETFDVEKFLAEAQQVGTEFDRLLEGARGKELLTDLGSGRAATARYVTALALYHGTTMSPAEFFILVKIREAMMSHAQELEAPQQAYLGPALTQLFLRDRTEWANIPFSTWQEELRLLKLMQGGTAGTVFI